MGATVILYPTDTGVAMTQPVDLTIPILELARGTTPAGVPFILVDEIELPDGNYFEAWSADFSEPDGYGIGIEAWTIARQNALNATAAAAGPTQEVLAAAEENARQRQIVDANLAAAAVAAQEQFAENFAAAQAETLAMQSAAAAQNAVPPALDATVESAVPTTDSNISE